MPHRDRITVTIRQDLLRGLDRMVDHQRIRNRSHALEVILNRTLASDTNQAVILASGEGVQMRPFTYETPKPLIPLHGKPMLEYGIALLRQQGVTNIVVTVSHLAEKIMDHFGDGSRHGVSITYVKERRPTGTGGALRAAQKHLGSAPFIVLYGDVLLDLEVMEFVSAHQQNKTAVGTIALTSVADPSAYGSVRLRGTRVVAFSEKPSLSDSVSRLVFAGCGVFGGSVFSYFPRRANTGTLSLEQDIFPKLIEDGRLYGYPFEGNWFDVSTPEVYEQALQRWPKKT